MGPDICLVELVCGRSSKAGTVHASIFLQETLVLCARIFVQLSTMRILPLEEAPAEASSTHILHPKQVSENALSAEEIFVMSSASGCTLLLISSRSSSCFSLERHISGCLLIFGMSRTILAAARTSTRRSASPPADRPRESRPI